MKKCWISLKWHQKVGNLFTNQYLLRYTIIQHLFNLACTTLVFRKDGFGKIPAFYCHVAETKSEQPVIIGYSLHYYIYSTWKGKNVYLEDLYIEKQYRGQGIGTDMLKAVAKVLHFNIFMKNGKTVINECAMSNLAHFQFFLDLSLPRL